MFSKQLHGRRNQHFSVSIFSLPLSLSRSLSDKFANEDLGTARSTGAAGWLVAEKSVTGQADPAAELKAWSEFNRCWGITVLLLDFFHAHVTELSVHSKCSVISQPKLPL